MLNSMQMLEAKMGALALKLNIKRRIKL